MCMSCLAFERLPPCPEDGTHSEQWGFGGTLRRAGSRSGLYVLWEEGCVTMCDVRMMASFSARKSLAFAFGFECVSCRCMGVG